MLPGTARKYLDGQWFMVRGSNLKHYFVSGIAVCAQHIDFGRRQPLEAMNACPQCLSLLREATATLKKERASESGRTHRAPKEET